MPRPLSFALIAGLCLAFTARAEDKPSPAVKRILDKAVGKVRANRTEFDKANKKPLDEARAELQDLSTKLIKDGKTDEAGVVLKQVGRLEADVMKMANAPAPVGGGAVAQKPLLDRLEGKWRRDFFHEDYVFFGTGILEARSKTDGKVLYTGRCRVVSDDGGEVELQNGHRWAFKLVGDDWIVIRETKSSTGDYTNDGIVLTRMD